MAGAVIIGEPGLPEELASQNVDLCSGRAFREAGAGNGDHPL